MPLRIVFVCTANCCRSPLAEILFEKILINELGSLQAIREKNLIIESAATKYSGLKIAEQSAQLLINEESISENRCQHHCGRQLEEIMEPDLVLAMTNAHVFQIIDFQPDWKNKIFTLDGFVKKDLGENGKDIKDPIGGSDQEYKKMKEQVKECLYLLVDEFKESGLL